MLRGHFLLNGSNRYLLAVVALSHSQNAPQLFLSPPSQKPRKPTKTAQPTTGYRGACLSYFRGGGVDVVCYQESFEIGTLYRNVAFFANQENCPIAADNNNYNHSVQHIFKYYSYYYYDLDDSTYISLHFPRLRLALRW